MRKLHLLAFALGLVFVVAVSPKTQAQRPARFYPARPTFSNFLLYRQLNGTGLPNYYSFIRPSTQYRDFLRRSNRPTARDRTTLSVEQEVARALESQLRQRVSTGIGQPSVPAQFNDTSHFYPSSRAVGPRR